MQTPKKDWTQQERDRFERIVCALMSQVQSETINTFIIFKNAEEVINNLDNFYNEQGTNENNN